MARIRVHETARGRVSARHYLTHSSLTTAGIAYLLAYDDTNSCYRAFRTWTGSTPATVRTARAQVAAASAGR